MGTYVQFTQDVRITTDGIATAKKMFGKVLNTYPKRVIGHRLQHTVLLCVKRTRVSPRRLPSVLRRGDNNIQLILQARTGVLGNGSRGTRKVRSREACFKVNSILCVIHTD